METTKYSLRDFIIILRKETKMEKLSTILSGTINYIFGDDYHLPWILSYCLAQVMLIEIEEIKGEHFLWLSQA